MIGRLLLMPRGSVDDLQELFPSHVVAGDGVCAGTLGAGGGAVAGLTDLTDGKHGSTTGRIEGRGQFVHHLDLVDENGPDGTTAGLSTEDVRQLEDSNCEVVIGKLEDILFLIETGAHVGVSLGKLHVRAVLG